MKPGYMLGIIACCLLMTIGQMAATKCLTAFNGDVTLSSQYAEFGPDNCIDGDINTFCHTKDEGEKNPYFMIEYASPTKINEVKVMARKNCCSIRVKEVVVIVTDTKPTKGQLALGTQLGSTFHGPATRGGQVISFKSEGGVTGKYVIVQQQYEGIMNLAEVEINPVERLKMLKNVYTNCIQNPYCEGCGDIVKNRLPTLLQENILKEGEIGVNNGSTSYTGSNYLKQWATTLTLRKVGDIKTIKTDNERVTINGTVNGMVGGKRWYAHMRRRPTGLYAGAGDLVTLTFPEDLVGKVSIDIGHFQFILSFPVEASVVKVGSPYGGLIIVWMNEKDSYKGEFTFSVTNAIRAPCFVYGKTTNEQWEEMRHYSPKWSVLRVLGQVEIFVQTLRIKDITDMDATLSRIKNTMDVLEESVGLPAGSKPGAEILIIDPARRGGMHVWARCTPGQNVCGDSLYIEDKVNTKEPHADQDYDAFFNLDGTQPIVLHEFGHSFCLGDFPDMGSQWTAETVHSYVRYTKGLSEMDYDYRYSDDYDYYYGYDYDSGMIKRDLDFWLLERMVGFSMYSGGKPCGEVKFNRKQFHTTNYERCWKWLNWFPEKAHGWHIWKDVNTLDAKSTKSYNTGTDRLVDLYCQATKHNMLPMFNWYNIKPSDEAITNNCQKLPESDLITKWLNVAKCVKQSLTSGDKDIRECGKMPRFPEHKGLCVISGVCNIDETNNGDQTTMNKKFDLYGSTGKRLNFPDHYFPDTSSSVKKETCFKRAGDVFIDCKNDKNQPITATFYSKEQGNEFDYSFPPRGNCYYDWPRLLPKYEGSTPTMIPKKCNEMCKEASYSYFGLQNYNECWCGNEAPPIEKKKDLEECDKMCKGDTNLRCGGGWKTNIWKVCSNENCEFKYE